jgi:ABC-type multidrug transport system fused ATPase/permease subunit
MDFDRIMVLEAGNIVEVDTPKNLMAKDSAFRKLYEA